MSNLILQGITAEELSKLIAVEVQKLQSQNQQTTPDSDHDLITIKEACEMLNVSRGTLYRYESQGRINIYGIGARRLLKRSELLESLTLKK